jgi:hypothetical protein
VELRPIDESDAIISTFQGVIARGEASWQNAPKLLRRIIEEDRWRRRYVEEIRKEVSFGYFEEFIRADIPEGLETTVDLLKRLCSGDMHVTSLLTQALKRKQGKKVSIGNDLDPKPVGNMAATALRRLRKDRPDLLAKVEAGKMTAHAAMIQAGFRRPMIQIPKDPIAAVPVLRRYFTGEWRAILVQGLLDAADE